MSSSSDTKFFESAQALFCAVVDYLGKPIKGKDRPEISIKLYKSKPDQAEFNRQMKRVAGHEFGG